MPVSRVHISARRHDDNRAGRTPRDLSRDAAEQGRARPSRPDDDHRCLLCCRCGNELVGWMADVDEPAGAAVHLGRAGGNALEPFGGGADLRFGRTILDDGDENQPEPEVAAQAAGNPGGSLGGLRVVDTANDWTRHLNPPSFVSCRLSCFDRDCHRGGNPSQRRIAPMRYGDRPRFDTSA